MKKQRKVIFFDRDDTLIEDKIYLNDPEQVIYFDQAVQALTLLRDHGFEFIIVTNQSGIARGLVEERNLQAIHKKIQNDFAQHQIYFLDFYHAPYLTTSDHYYRKPRPGMINEGIHTYHVDTSKSWMVGDRMTDVEAGHRAGLKSILLGQKERPEDYPYSPPEGLAHSLMDVCRIVLNHTA